MGKSFFKKVIVAVNGRQSSIQAAMYAIMMCKTYNISLKFVYVVDTATIKYLTMNRFLVTDEKMDFETRLREDGNHYLDYVCMLAGTKGLKVERELREGGVFSEIIQASNEYDADLILLGGNILDSNKKNEKRHVLSSEENNVMTHSNCPVMIVQKPDIEKIFKIF